MVALRYLKRRPVEHLAHLELDCPPAGRWAQRCAHTPAAMRGVQACLLQPIDPSASLTDLGQELCLLGVDSAKATQFVQSVTGSLQGPSPHNAGQLMGLTDDDVKRLESAAKFSTSDALTLRICLRSGQSPFEFPSSTALVIPSAGDAEGVGLAKGVEKTEPMQAAKADKGGALEVVSGKLRTRRDPLMEYYPPPTFDEDAKDNPLRSVSRLRMKIVKEIEDVCGDLYPSSDERGVILKSIDLLCGPPVNGPSWDHFYTNEGKKRAKHKGTAVCDIERARRNPVAHGCHGTAVEGQMRPARPKRKPPVFDPRSDTRALESGGQEGKKSRLDDDDDLENYGEEDDDDLEDYGLKGGNSLLKEAEELKGEVERLRAETAAAKEAKKAANKAAKADAAKGRASAAQGQGRGKTARKEQRGTKRKTPGGEDAVEPVDGENISPQNKEPSAYELAREETMALNAQMLAFIEATQKAKMNILDNNDAWLLLTDERPLASAAPDK